MDDEKRLTIFTKFVLGDIVYLKIRKERNAGMVTCISVRPGNMIYYGITWEDGYEGTHYDIELTDSHESTP